MSFNQSRSDKSEAQFRKTGRSAGSNQQRTYSGAYGKGAGGVPAPSPSLSSSASLSSNRSFKKSNNAQGGQSRVNSSESTNASAARNVQNGTHVGPQLQGGGPDVPRPIEPPSNQRGARHVPKGPAPQSTTVTSDNATTAVPSKGDSSKAFPFQFGTITVEGMQIPAQTSSAPPNLDEQKRDQARHDSAFRAVPNLSIPVPKQQLPRKDSVATDQSNAGEVHPVRKVKKDIETPPAPANQTQKPSVLTMSISSMQMPPYHQIQVSMQFGAPNPPIQLPATSLQMPMHMPLLMGNAPPVQLPVFVQSLQGHPLPPQGMIHQGQGLGFPTTMGGQLPPQLGNMGMGITPQYPQRQGAKLSAPHKTVKITHPETHEELRLDKRTETYSDARSSGLRSHPNLPSQSQPIPSFPPSHPIGYYPNSMFYPPSSLPLSSSQLTPKAQGQRFNYPVSQGPQNVPFLNSAAGHNSFPVNKAINPMHGVLYFGFDPVHRTPATFPNHLCFLSLCTNMDPEEGTEKKGVTLSDDPFNKAMVQIDLHLLPREILLEILSRLCITSLIHFKSTSHAGRNLISDPGLPAMFRNRVSNSNPCLILFGYNFHVCRRLYFLDSEAYRRRVRKIDPPQHSKVSDLVGSCNGLLCVSYPTMGGSYCVSYPTMGGSSPAHGLLIYNPFVGDAVRVPPVNPFLIHFEVFGFGFHPRTGEFKVVRIVYYEKMVTVADPERFVEEANGGFATDEESMVQVFTLGTMEWRQKGAPPRHFANGIGPSEALVEGSLHWVTIVGMGRDSRIPIFGIISFELADEVFEEIPHPPCQQFVSRRYSLSVLNGCLSAAGLVDTVHFDIWVMKQYHVKESWVKQFSFDPSLNGRWSSIDGRFTKVICALKNGEILLQYKDISLVSYDPVENRFRTLYISGLPNHFQALSFQPSLFSANATMNLQL